MLSISRSLVMLFALGLLVNPLLAQDKPYREGSVWSMSFVKVKNGLFDDYMSELFPVRQRIMEEAKKQGLILSHKVFVGNSSSRDDCCYVRRSPRADCL